MREGISKDGAWGSQELKTSPVESKCGAQCGPSRQRVSSEVERAGRCRLRPLRLALVSWRCLLLIEVDDSLGMNCII